MKLDLEKPLDELLADHKACDDGREWAKEYRSASAAWEACANPKWMLWALQEIGIPETDPRVRKFACWCARHTPLGDGRTTWDLLTDPRSRAAVDVAERFADGNATQEELDAARAAARAAAGAAWDAARSAVRSVAWDAAWAAVSAAGFAAPWDTARDAQCGAIRQMFGNPFRKKRGGK